MVDRNSLLDQLKSLLDSQLEALIFRLQVDKTHLQPGLTQNQRSIELIELFEQQQDGLQRLQETLHELGFLKESLAKDYPKPSAQGKSKVPFVLPKIDISTFTGRIEELQQLESQLLGTNGEKVCSIVGLSGGGGMGKSALAFHFATKYKDWFPDGVIGLPVDGKAVRKVAREFARLCSEEIDEEDDRSASTIMQEVFAHRRMLLIFDNADRADLKALRPGGQCCALIVTTRDRSIPNSFGIPNQGVIDLPVFPDDDARNLLRNIVGERVNDEPEAVNRIIEMTGKLPLALEIAGSTLEQNSTLSFSRYAEYLNEEEERLKELETDSDIELNVTASLNLSLKFLENSDIDLFACLSVCAKDGFSLETAMKAGGLTNQRESRRLLNRLYRLSLLNAISEERYVSHILVRIYAQDLARKRNLWDAAAQRHAEYFLYLVQSNDVESPEIAKQIAEDFSDILQAAQWLRDTAASDELKESAYQFALDLRPFLLKYSDSKKAVELMAGFQEWAEGLDDWTASVKFKIQHAKYLALEGSLAEAESILRKAQDSIDRISNPLHQQKSQAQQLNSLGGILQKQGKLEAAIAAFERQIKIAEALNDQSSVAIGLNCLGGLWQQQGNTEAAIAAFERRIRISEALNDQSSVAIGLNCLGGLWQQQGNTEAAIAAFERQIKIAETLNDQNSVAIGLTCLGSLLQQQGKLEEAIAAFKKTVEIEESLGEKRGLAMALSSLSNALRATGDLQAAILVLERIVTLEKNLGNHVGVAMTLRTLGSLLRQQGDLPNAIASSRKAVEIGKRLDNPTQQAKSLSSLAETLHEYGRLTLKSPDLQDQVEASLRESWQIYEQLENPFQVAVVLHSLGRVLKTMDRLDAAENALQESREKFTDLKDDKQLLMVLNTLGGVLASKQDWKSSEKVLRESYDLARKVQDVRSQAIISNSLGQLFSKQNGAENFSLARMYFLNSIKSGKIANDQVHLAKVHTAWGQALIRNGQLEEGIVELHQGFEIDEQRRSSYGLQQVTQILATTLVKLGRQQEALGYCDRAVVAANNHPRLLQLRSQVATARP